MSRDEIERLETKIDNVEKNLSEKIDSIKEKYFAMYGIFTSFIENSKITNTEKKEKEKIKLEKFIYPACIIIFTIAVTKFSDYFGKLLKIIFP